MTVRSIELNSDFKPSGAPPVPGRQFEIAPKATGEVWLHNGQDCVLEEV